MLVVDDIKGNKCKHVFFSAEDSKSPNNEKNNRFPNFFLSLKLKLFGVLLVINIVVLNYI